MSTFHYDDLLNAGERHISSLNPLSIEHEKNIIIAKENQTVNYFRSHFAPPKSAQTPTNYTSKRGKSIQLIGSGGAFVIPSMCCQARPVFLGPPLPRPVALLYIREIKTRVYGKRQTSDSHLRFLKMKNTYARMVQNDSHVYGEHETIYLH